MGEQKYQLLALAAKQSSRCPSLENNGPGLGQPVLTDPTRNGLLPAKTA